MAKREVVAMMPTYLPGIDEKTTGGFILLSGYHIIVMAFGFFALAGSDFLFTMVVTNTPIMACLAKMEAEQLNEELKNQESASMIKWRLRNILLMHLEMTE